MVTVVLVENPDFDLPYQKPVQTNSLSSPSQAQAHEQAASHQTKHTAAATTPPAGDPTDRYRRIAERAYSKAQSRGFAPGHMWEDWLAAEREVDGLPPPQPPDPQA
jgi:hypothetical protein